MSGTNIAIQVGRLVRDPEIKDVGNTKLTTFAIANNYNYTSNGEKREESFFLDCIVWGSLGEKVVMPYCKKGKQVCVSGRLRLNQWQTPEGQNRRRIELIVDQMELLGGSGNSNKPPEGNYTPPDHVAKSGEENQDPNNAPSGQESQVSNFDDDDIPF